MCERPGTWAAAAFLWSSAFDKLLRSSFGAERIRVIAAGFFPAAVFQETAAVTPGEVSESQIGNLSHTFSDELGSA